MAWAWEDSGSRSLSKHQACVRPLELSGGQDSLILSIGSGHGAGPHSRLPISAKLVEREAFLENANWVYQQAVVGNIFRGQAGDKPSKQQVQALTLNGLGWNGGISSPTRSLAAHAWWNLSPDAAPTLFNNLSEIHQTDDQIRELFQLARANSTGDGLPCKAHPNHQHHRYQVNNGRPFRIRCCMHGCYHKLQRAAIIHWIAELGQLQCG
jgi:hypothetical protein